MIDLIKNYVIGALFLALCGAVVYAHSLKKVVAENDKTMQDQRDEIGGYKKDLESTTSLVKNFSDSFEQLKIDQARREKEVEDAMAQVEQLAAIHVTYSSQILSTRPKSTDLCKESDDLINSYISRGVTK